MARVKSPLPSATISTLPSHCCDLPHASMTNASFTARQATEPTPLLLISPAFSTKPGRCRAEHVGVKAPGTAKGTTFSPVDSLSVLTSFGPTGVMRRRLTAGILSPTLIVIASPPEAETGRTRHRDGGRTPMADGAILRVARQQPRGLSARREALRRSLRCPIERSRDGIRRQQLRKNDALRRTRAIDRIEGNAVPAERCEVCGDLVAGARPVRSHRPDLLFLEQPARNRLPVEHGRLVDLAGDAPVRGYVHEHDLPLRNE